MKRSKVLCELLDKSGQVKRDSRGRLVSMEVDVPQSWLHEVGPDGWAGSLRSTGWRLTEVETYEA